MALYDIGPDLQLGGGLLAWNGEGGAMVGALLEATLRGDRWWAGFDAEINGPWTDSVEAGVLGGVRHVAQLEGGFSPFARFTLSGAVEQAWYSAEETDLSGESVSEFRLRLRSEYRIWQGEGVVGRHFFDAALRQESLIETFVGVGVQYDSVTTSGSDELMEFAQLVPRSNMISIGPNAGYAGDGWGVTGNLFVGIDSARDLALGDLFGGSVTFVVLPSDRWKLGGSMQYWSEQLESTSGSAWVLTIGGNYNF
jgi:hypothetical protein